MGHVDEEPNDAHEWKQERIEEIFFRVISPEVMRVMLIKQGLRFLLDEMEKFFFGEGSAKVDGYTPE